MTNQLREYVKAMDDVLDDLDSKHDSRPGVGADALVNVVEHAATSGELWAQAKTAEWSRDAARRELNRRAKDRDRVAVSHQGAVVELGHRRGTRSRDRESGEVVHQQRLIEYLTPAEVDQRIADGLRQLQALGVDLAAMRRVQQLCSAHPRATTVAEALVAGAVTLDDVLMGRWAA